MHVVDVYAPLSTLFRSKTVIELGSGYGLAGLVVAMATEASEVVISDGNPQVVDCILFMLSSCHVQLHYVNKEVQWYTYS